jgi:hypothetical protein
LGDLGWTDEEIAKVVYLAVGQKGGRRGHQLQCREGDRPHCGRRGCSRSRTRSSNETARVHHPPRRRGGVAARGARAAGDRVRRIGVLMSWDENDPEGKLRYSAFNGDSQR